MRMTIPDAPKMWSRKTVRKFLWKPLTIGKERRWLETAEIVMELIPTGARVGRSVRLPSSRWVNRSWADIDPAPDQCWLSKQDPKYWWPGLRPKGIAPPPTRPTRHQGAS